MTIIKDTKTLLGETPIEELEKLYPKPDFSNLQEKNEPPIIVTRLMYVNIQNDTNFDDYENNDSRSKQVTQTEIRECAGALEMGFDTNEDPMVVRANTVKKPHDFLAGHCRSLSLKFLHDKPDLDFEVPVWEVKCTDLQAERIKAWTNRDKPQRQLKEADYIFQLTRMIKEKIIKPEQPVMLEFIKTVSGKKRLAKYHRRIVERTLAGLNKTVKMRTLSGDDDIEKHLMPNLKKEFRFKYKKKGKTNTTHECMEVIKGVKIYNHVTNNNEPDRQIIARTKNVYLEHGAYTRIYMKVDRVYKTKLELYKARKSFYDSAMKEINDYSNKFYTDSNGKQQINPFCTANPFNNYVEIVGFLPQDGDWDDMTKIITIDEIERVIIEEEKKQVNKGMNKQLGIT